MSNNLGWDELKYLNFFKERNMQYPFLLDIGANLGDFTDEFLKLFPEGVSYCFEPIKEIYKKLNERFGFDLRVSTKNIGLSNENNFDVDMWYVKDAAGYENSTGLSSLFYRKNYYPAWNVLKTKIQLFKLDDVWDYNINKIDYVKIDVEGSEFNVLLGAKKFFQEIKPYCVQWEYGQCYEDAGVTGKQTVELLESYGYKTFNRVFFEQKSVTFYERYADVQNFFSIRSDLIKE